MSGRHPTDLLADYAAGLLPDETARRIDAHLATCARCARELGSLADALSALALTLPAPRPPSELFARVLGDAVPGARFDRFAAQVAGLIDVEVATARGLLARIDDAAAWEAGPLPNVDLFHLPGGPRVAGADVGFVRVRAGTTFPLHRHGGREHVLVLQGRARDSDGTVSRPGDEVIKPQKSEHSFEVLAGADFVYLVVLVGGFEIV